MRWIINSNAIQKDEVLIRIATPYDETCAEFRGGKDTRKGLDGSKNVRLCQSRVGLYLAGIQVHFARLNIDLTLNLLPFHNHFF